MIKGTSTTPASSPSKKECVSVCPSTTGSPPYSCPSGPRGKREEGREGRVEVRFVSPFTVFEEGGREGEGLPLGRSKMPGVDQERGMRPRRVEAGKPRRQLQGTKG